ncbi:apoptosis regulator BAX [Latimeria chalumnae]|uniref:BCL2 associated X, apoptosis regulator n=1 Tax=Latimeria chalumnae TaxID=7897 RepID=H3ABM8_LATCH|nr:PREDICTED: apoptosis regulator BAX [Latimeria chalumnae]|eukprot:XP_005996773.1 PREDICTED: apoptosis regulator BAX [Latimeria chalumnae]
MADECGCEDSLGSAEAAWAAGDSSPRAQMGRRTPASNADNATEQILQTGQVLLKGFILDRIQRGVETRCVQVTPDQLGVTEEQLSNPSFKNLANCLRQIGDELDGNQVLQREISRVKTDSSKEVFFQVVREVFSDGKFNWGRVVALFYFACKLIIRALCENIPKIVRTIIEWTMEYLRDHVVQWIREQGGWDSICLYVKRHNYHVTMIFLTGFLAAFLVMRFS